MSSTDRMATLHFLCGKLASGKTTLAARIAAECDAVLVSEDVWLSRLFPDPIGDFTEYLRRSARLRAALGPHVIDVLRHGASVVFDFAGNVPRERAWVRSVFEAAHAQHVLHYVDASDALCKRRLQRRNAAASEGSQYTTDAEFDAITAYFVPPDPSEGFNVREYQAADE